MDKKCKCPCFFCARLKNCKRCECKDSRESFHAQGDEGRMRFSEWLEKRLSEALNPKLDRLKREEKQLLMSMENRKDPTTGAVVGINKAGYIDAAEELKKVRVKIKELEGGLASGDKVRPIPTWIQSRKAI